MPRKRIKPDPVQVDPVQVNPAEVNLIQPESAELDTSNQQPNSHTAEQTPHPLDVLCRQISVVSNLPPEQFEQLKGELGIGSLPRGRAFNRISEVLAITVALRREVREERANP